MGLTDGPESHDKKSTELKHKVPQTVSLRTGLETREDQAEMGPQGTQSGHLL